MNYALVIAMIVTSSVVTSGSTYSQRPNADENARYLRRGNVTYRHSETSNRLKRSSAVHLEIQRANNLEQFLTGAIKAYPNVESVVIEGKVQPEIIKLCRQWKQLEKLVVDPGPDLSFECAENDWLNEILNLSQASAIRILRKRDLLLVTAVADNRAYPQIESRHFEKVIEIGRYRTQPVFSPPIPNNLFSLIGRIRTLEKLDLGNSEITDEKLVPILALPKLRELSLENTGITGSGIPQVDFPHVEVLHCAGTKVSGEFIKHFPNLTELDLRWTPVSDDCCAQIANLKGLRRLMICGTGITDAVWKDLEKLESLEFVWVDESFRESEGLRKFQNAHPDTEIAFY